MEYSSTLLFKVTSSISALLDRLKTEDETRIPATFEEYLEVADQADFKLEYSGGHIVSLPFPAAFHEQICSNACWALNNVISDDDPFLVLGSNFGIHLHTTSGAYKPDVSVFNGTPQYNRFKVGKKTYKLAFDPFAVFEVFSDGTMDYDMTEKLPAYKLCPSLRYIIYIHQHKPFVTIFHRQNDDPESWLSKDCVGLESSFKFEGQSVEVKKLYRKVVFLGASEKEEPAPKD